MKEESIYDYADEITTLSIDDLFTNIAYQKMDERSLKRIREDMSRYARRKCREQRLICQKDFEDGRVKINKSIIPVIE